MLSIADNGNFIWRGLFMAALALAFGDANFAAAASSENSLARSTAASTASSNGPSGVRSPAIVPQSEAVPLPSDSLTPEPKPMIAAVTPASPSEATLPGTMPTTTPSSQPSSSDATPPELLASLAGCFQVSYRFVEDGENDLRIEGSFELIEARAPTVPGAQWAFQHYGVLEGQKFKHWSEEWETRDGAYVQHVQSPGGAPRYDCAGQFSFRQFRCAAAGTPKPQRDFDRVDYETIDRDQLLQFTPKGWVQSEINLKRDAVGKEVASELGWIEYKRVDALRCVPTVPGLGAEFEPARGPTI